jgi:hypothetical protein
MFGAINGTSEAGAAILGVLINRIDTVDRADVRINGCIVGSVGGGCLINNASQPAIGVFDPSKAVVFKATAGNEVPFDPIVGTNNESLFGDVGTFGLDDLPVTSKPECNRDTVAACSVPEGPRP